MLEMEQHFIKINNQEIHARVWNANASETVFCSHGFTRTSADFLVLGELLASFGYRVIASDALGRGLSQWSRDPLKEYNLSNYAKLAINILDHFECEKFHWVGCDMGGLIGIILASNDNYKHLFSSLTLNDIGPEIPKKTVEEIIKKAKQKHCFTQFQDVLGFFENEYYPPCQDRNVWQKVCESSVRRLSVGGFTLHYDNNIFLSNGSNTIKLWNRFRQLAVPLMVMYGVNSKVLTKSILVRMRELQRQLVVNYYLGCHHPPSLLSASYCQDVLNFIQRFQSKNVLSKNA